MKRNVLVITFILLAGTVWAQAPQGPKISVQETRHDVGVVAQGVTASYVFEVRNEGTATLVIERVQPG